MVIFNVSRGQFCELYKGTKNIIAFEPDIFDSEAAYIVSDFALHRQEKTSITECFQDKNYVYAFGGDPNASGFSVKCAVLLNSGCKAEPTFESNKNISKLLKKFEEKRVSKQPQTIKMTVDGAVYQVLLLSQDVSVISAEMHMFGITFSGKIISYG